MVTFNSRAIETDLLSDETLDVRRNSEGFKGFVNYLEGELFDYTIGDKKFEYVSDLHGDVDYVNEDGEPVRETIKVDGKYIPMDGEIEIDSKYKGNDAGTLSVLAHELYHRTDPDEGNEDYVELMAGLALKTLAGKYELADNAFFDWRIRKYTRRKEAIEKDGEDAWNKRMEQLTYRLTDKHPEAGYVIERYQKAAGERSKMSDILFEGLFGFPKWAEKGIKKVYNSTVAAGLKNYLGVNIDADVKSGVTDWFEKLAKTMYETKKQQEEKSKKEQDNKPGDQSDGKANKQQGGRQTTIRPAGRQQGGGGGRAPRRPRPTRPTPGAGPAGPAPTPAPPGTPGTTLHGPPAPPGAGNAAPGPAPTPTPTPAPTGPTAGATATPGPAPGTAPPAGGWMSTPPTDIYNYNRGDVVYCGDKKNYGVVITADPLTDNVMTWFRNPTTGREAWTDVPYAQTRIVGKSSRTAGYGKHFRDFLIDKGF
ncbi:MAG: hypothetical protein ISS93_02960 [Candidatus Aenigmarchaeota archaeon]|nr:hypothetical protein [Candidatus Aenigmarchaeota archaeon]